MRTQHKNPAYKKFNNLLPANGRYPAKWVDIFNNIDDDGKYRDIEVVFIPREAVPDGDEGKEFWNKYGIYTDHWFGDLGNSCAGWLEDGFTPASVFGGMLEIGFANKAELRRALEEFAHIEECDWARDMLQAFERDED